MEGTVEPWKSLIHLWDESYPVNEVLRCIHIALLCVQEQANGSSTHVSSGFHVG